MLQGECAAGVREQGGSGGGGGVRYLPLNALADLLPVGGAD